MKTMTTRGEECILSNPGSSVASSSIFITSVRRMMKKQMHHESQLLTRIDIQHNILCDIY